MTNTLTDDEIDRIIRYGTARERAAAMDTLGVQQEAENAVERAQNPPCPGWCVLQAGHVYEGVLPDDENTRARSHLALSERLGVQVCVEERNRGGVVELGTPFIVVYGDGDEMNAEQAEQLGDTIRAAAQRLREISSEQASE
ncbi:MAG: hypothetical protein ACR2KJ_00610 [Jatrophihabitans sp.]